MLLPFIIMAYSLSPRKARHMSGYAVLGDPDIAVQAEQWQLFNSYLTDQNLF